MAMSGRVLTGRILLHGKNGKKGDRSHERNGCSALELRAKGIERNLYACAQSKSIVELGFLRGHLLARRFVWASLLPYDCTYHACGYQISLILHYLQLRQETGRGQMVRCCIPDYCLSSPHISLRMDYLCEGHAVCDEMKAGQFETFILTGKDKS